MQVQKRAAFTEAGQGGNPAGVVIGEMLPPDHDMQTIAAEVGFSETVFAAPCKDGFRVRYFAPRAEVPFCGHATIALGAALGMAHGAKPYRLYLNAADISVTAYQDGAEWGARLVSPPTSHKAVTPELQAELLDLFGLQRSDIDPALGLAQVNGGADHLLCPLVSHQALRDMVYDFDQGAQLMQRAGLVTINMVWRKDKTLFYSRNPFAGHGVYEDPATGAAAAALAGYLRDVGLQGTSFDVLQGLEMGRASRLHVTPRPGIGAPVEVAGLTAAIL